MQPCYLRYVTCSGYSASPCTEHLGGGGKGGLLLPGLEKLPIVLLAEVRLHCKSKTFDVDTSYVLTFQP
jgi:hypothetical protein